MNVLHVSPSFYPATRFGGPIWSTLELCNCLAEQPNLNVKVVTTDMGCEGVDTHSKSCSLQNFMPLNYDVTYARCIFGRDIAPGLITTLLQEIRRADIIHLTGVYSFPTLPTLFLARAAKKPVLWSPRGALLASENWEAASHPKKKRAWEACCTRLSSKSRTVLHVTSQPELGASLGRMPQLRAVMIPNGVEIPRNIAPPKRKLTRERCKDEALNILYIGRLHPIKALENLIVALSILPTGFATLSILGRGSSAYKGDLVNLVNSLGLTESVSFHGHFDEDAKQEAYARADVCVLPSHSENFGMVVAEALASCTPVIASAGVPWPELEVRNCGIWTKDNTPECLAEALIDINQRDRRTMGRNGRRWMQSEFNWHQISRMFVSVYEAMRHNTHLDDPPFIALDDLK